MLHVPPDGMEETGPIRFTTGIWPEFTCGGTTVWYVRLEEQLDRLIHRDYTI